MTQDDLNKKVPTNIIFFSLSFLLLIGAFFWIIFSKYPPGWDFKNNLYLPSYLIVQNINPYDIHSLVDNGTALWFPMVLGLFFPLGYLDLQRASNIWILVNLVSFLSLIFISSNQKKPSLIKLFIVGSFIFMIPSTIAHINLGQISILICLSLVIIIMFDEILPIWATGLLLSFSLSKPQLVVLFIPAYLFYIFRNQGWKSVLSLIFWTTFGVIIFSLPVFFTKTNWLNSLILNLKSNPIWQHPSIITILSSSLNEYGFLLRYFFLLVGLILALFLVSRSGNKVVFLWILALTTVFSPYIWSWDFVLLYPLMIFTMFQKKRVIEEFLLFAGYFFIIGIFILFRLSGVINDINFWWVPWGLMSVTFFVQWLSKKYKNV